MFKIIFIFQLPLELGRVRLSYTALPSFTRLSRALCGRKYGRTIYYDKKKIIAHRDWSFSMLLFPLSLARNKKNRNIESRIYGRLCTMQNDTGLYSFSCKERCAVEEALFLSTKAAIPHLCTCGATQWVTF